MQVSLMFGNINCSYYLIILICYCRVFVIACAVV
jgi:hypothetical protein